ncbi:unnamed protein product [Dovyalis caffra]|uniref:Integral membrane bound transporter domain-containing protein n=1 Tax=Dovyalis caffra TaxID=77055 RepID=A0AAV1REJ8_9ROSI|nr:unnamed protein product [Dovyalis caffra]
MLDRETKQGLVQLKEHVNQTLKQIKNFLPRDSLTVSESNAENIVESLRTVQTISTNHQDLPSFFFLFCMKLLHSKSLAKPIAPKQQKGSSTSCTQNGFFKSTWMSNWSTIVNSKRLMPAFKCSLSLGLAVLFGLIYSKKDGYWSGLPVAISLAAAREATFKVANVKAQGTVLGTVYGVFCCFVFERYLPIRFISLLPWFVVSSFLRHSQMYGQAGGISAEIGAILVLGRKIFGPPSDFAIARIVETFIGLSCSILVDLLLQPTRASSLTKVQLSKCFGTLSACIDSISLAANKNNLVESQRRLKLDVSELAKFIGEAEVEPNFWFLPFHSACYCKILGSLSKLVDLLLFSADIVGLLEHESHKFGASWKECVNKLDSDLQLFKEMAGSLVKCLEDVTLLKSLTFLEKELENKNISYDLELGKSSNRNIFKVSGVDEDKIDNIISSYLQHSKEIVDKFRAADHEGERELKSQVVLCLSALGFCMSNLIKETEEIERGIQELLQWENPSKHINLYEISCKIRSLYN